MVALALVLVIFCEYSKGLITAIHRSCRTSAKAPGYSDKIRHSSDEVFCHVKNWKVSQATVPVSQLAGSQVADDSHEKIRN